MPRSPLARASQSSCTSKDRRREATGVAQDGLRPLVDRRHVTLEFAWRNCVSLYMRPPHVLCLMRHEVLGLQASSSSTSGDSSTHDGPPDEPASTDTMPCEPSHSRARSSAASQAWLASEPRSCSQEDQATPPSLIIHHHPRSSQR